MAGSSNSLHEPDLPSDVVDRHRAIVSIMEELEAVDWYDQRAAATADADLAEVLGHNRDEEKEHAVMTLEWLRRHDPTLDQHLRTYLFTEGDILAIEDDAEHGGDAGSDPTDGSLAIGSLRHDDEDSLSNHLIARQGAHHRRRLRRRSRQRRRRLGSTHFLARPQAGRPPHGVAHGGSHSCRRPRPGEPARRRRPGGRSCRPPAPGRCPLPRAGARSFDCSGPRGLEHSAADLGGQPARPSTSDAGERGGPAPGAAAGSSCDAARAVRDRASMPAGHGAASTTVSTPSRGPRWPSPTTTTTTRSTWPRRWRPCGLPRFVTRGEHRHDQRGLTPWPAAAEASTSPICPPTWSTATGPSCRSWRSSRPSTGTTSGRRRPRTRRWPRCSATTGTRRRSTRS